MLLLDVLEHLPRPHDCLQEIKRVLKEEVQMGKPVETAALLMNIAISKTLLNWIKAKHPALILGIFVPPLVLGINLLCGLASYFSPEDTLMPHSYRWVFEKQDLTKM